MKRRTFIQSLLVAPIAPIVKKPPRQADPAPAYTDSNGRSAAELAPLHDGQRTSGGVVYQP